MAENKAIISLDINKIVSGTTAVEIDGKYLSFWLDKQLFAVGVSDVVQIGMQRSKNWSIA